METILLKIIVCSGILLGLYHLFLAKERIFTFNRFYLIFALLFSLCIPFATIETKQVHEEIPSAIFVEETVQPITAASTVAQQESFDYLKVLLIINFIVTGILLLKIGYSILKIKRLKGRKIDYQSRKIVLLEKDFAPFSFWDTIYLSENYFHDSKIDDTIFLHEAIHIKQKHSADILFVEIIKALFWFNPFIYFYKKAMVSNHEFIADESVLVQSNNVKNYQELILQEILKQQNLPLIHQFNFNNTKKRFIMMTSKNSKFAKAKKFLAIPAFAALAIVFAEKTYAKDNIENFDTKKSNTLSQAFLNSPYEEVQKILSKYNDLLKNRKYAEFDRTISQEDRKTLMEFYPQLSKQEKDELPFIFTKTKKAERNAVSENDLKEFSNAAKYGVWIDENKIGNATLKNYKASDFSHKSISKRYKNAISKKNPQPFQVNLMTNAYYDKYSKEEPRTLMSFKVRAFVKGKDTIPVKRNTEAKSQQDVAFGKEADLKPAEFPGGANKLRNFVSANFDGSIMKGDEGTIKTVIYFNVDEAGKVSNINATGENAKFNNEAMRVIKLANQDVTWKPAEKDGEPVKYRYQIPLVMNFETYKKTQ